MIPRKFEIDGIRYVTDLWGVVHQDPPEITQKYDVQYVQNRYDSIPDVVREMSFLRTGFIKGTIGDYFSILDIGYGNGDFLRTQQLWNLRQVQTYGTDVSGYPIPRNSTFFSWEELQGKHFSVACFFDSFEHLKDFTFMNWFKYQVDWLVFTIPWFKPELGINWFRQWKHRRPGEHIHHFSPDALRKMLQFYNFEFVAAQDLEDGIRRTRSGHENTFTAVFRKC